MAVPKTRAIAESTLIMLTLFRAGFPNFLISRFMCGFQWGTISKIKWLARAKGIDINGFGILLAMATATATCGVSSTVATMLYSHY